MLEAKNLTGRDYKLRLIDQVPVSEQKKVTVDWEASVEPTEQDPDGKRGGMIFEVWLPLDGTSTVVTHKEGPA